MLQWILVFLLCVSCHVAYELCQTKSHLRNVTEHVLLANERLLFDGFDSWCQHHCTLSEHPKNATLRNECHEHCDCPDTSHEVIAMATCDQSKSLDVDTAQNDTHVLTHFFEQFSTIYSDYLSAMLADASVAVPHCQLVHLQKSIFSNDERTATPTLLKVPRRKGKDCIAIVNAKLGDKWNPVVVENDNVSLLLTHTEQRRISNDMDCVEEVIKVPTLFKLASLAKSSIRFHGEHDEEHDRDYPLPSLLLQLDTAIIDSDALAEQLNAELKAEIGIRNLLSTFHQREYGKDKKAKSLLVMKSMVNVKNWITAVSLILDCPDVIMVDIFPVIQAWRLLQEDFLLVPGGVSLVEMQTELSQVHDILKVTNAHEHDIRGEGIVVAVSDTGVYMNHDQFDQAERDIYDNNQAGARKVVLYDTFSDNLDQSPDKFCGHGTHVAAIAVGSSLSKQHPNVGIAPNAKLAFKDVGTQHSSCKGERGCSVSLQTPHGANMLFGGQREAGAKIYSFSWGTLDSDYNSQTLSIDEYLYENPEILVIMAAGNSGRKGPKTIVAPAGGKNVLTVGASLNSGDTFRVNNCPEMLNAESVAGFSSYGPTSDGRIKPDIVAPGQTIESARSLEAGNTAKTFATCGLQGTSQAAPAIAGMAALISQWLQKGYWKNGIEEPQHGLKFIPSALLKGLIIHSSGTLKRRVGASAYSCSALKETAIPLQFPDFHQGYGLPQFTNLATLTGSSVSEKVFFLPNSTHGAPEIDEGGIHIYNYTVQPGDLLRVTIVWTDPPGSLMAEKTLQHDLDLTLTVQDGSGKVFYPLSGNGQPDRVNNVEMVQLEYDTLLSDVQENPGFASTNSSTPKTVVVSAKIQGFRIAAKVQAYSIIATSGTIGSYQSKITSVRDWQPWMTFALGFAGVTFIIAVLAVCYRCCRARKAHTDYTLVHENAYPVAPSTPNPCPHCSYISPNAVALVEHVVKLHPNV